MKSYLKKLHLPIITTKRHNKIITQTLALAQQEKDELEKLFQKVCGASEEARNSRSNYESQVREVFWELAKVGAIIKTYQDDYSGRLYYRYNVQFKPELEVNGHKWAYPYRGDNGQAIREAALLDRLIKTVGVPGWEYEKEYTLTLSRIYSDLEGILRVPADIQAAVGHLNKHLTNILRERQYQDILITEAKEPTGKPVEQK